MSLLGYLKIIPYTGTKFEHFGIIRFWVTLRTNKQNKQTNKQTDSNVLPTPTATESAWVTTSKYVMSSYWNSIHAVTSAPIVGPTLSCPAFSILAILLRRFPVLRRCPPFCFNFLLFVLRFSGSPFSIYPNIHRGAVKIVPFYFHNNFFKRVLFR